MSIDIAKRRILDKVPLASLISETVPLTTRSGRQVGFCPFHQENSPSFTIFDDHYFCFGCRAHGDAIEFVRHTQGLSFMETLKYLAEKYDVEAPELEDSRKAQESRRQASQLYKVLQLAQNYFSSSLEQQGAHVIEYLKREAFPMRPLKSTALASRPISQWGS